MSPLRPGRVLCVLAACVLPAAAVAEPVPPHLSRSGERDYRAYQDAGAHRAFAIAPGGAWGWVGEAASREGSLEGALAACRRNTVQNCVPYSVDGEIVFDATAWYTLWRPYAGPAQAKAAPEGTAPGQRFPQLAFKDPAGKPRTLADYRGRVVVLHFWGAWCGPCRHELPDLQRSWQRVVKQRGIEFVLLQVREPIAASRAWAAAQGLKLPLHDSGTGGEADAALRLAGGGELSDRHIAAAFPTTYFLDRHGLVLLRHVGPIARWQEYEGFLRDAAAAR